MVDLLEPFRVLMTSLFYVLALHLVHYPHPTWHTSLCFTMFFLPLNPAFCSHTAWLYTPGRQVLPVDLLKLPSTQFSLSLSSDLFMFQHNISHSALTADLSSEIHQPGSTLQNRSLHGFQQAAKAAEGQRLTCFQSSCSSTTRPNAIILRKFSVSVHAPTGHPTPCLRRGGESLWKF